MRNPSRLPAFKSHKEAAEAGKQLLDLVMRYAGESINTAGGVLTSEPIAAAIRDLRDKVGVFRSLATTIRMPSDTTRVPKRASGLTGYYVNENSQVTESQSGWDQITLTTRKIASLVRVSSELAEDAAGFAEFVVQELAYTLEAMVDVAAFAGDGTSTYQGQIGARTALASGMAGYQLASSNNDTWAEYTVADFASIVGLLPAKFHDNAKWIISPQGWAFAMCRLSATAGGPLELNGAPAFMGYEVALTSSMPGGTTSTDQSNSIVALFGDVSQAAVLGDRRDGTLVKRAEGRFLEYDQVAFLGTARFHSVWDGLGDTTTPGAVVALAGN